LQRSLVIHALATDSNFDEHYAIFTVGWPGTTLVSLCTPDSVDGCPRHLWLRWLRHGLLEAT
jgi:hypothetical protein